MCIWKDNSSVDQRCCVDVGTSVVGTTVSPWLSLCCNIYIDCRLDLARAGSGVGPEALKTHRALLYCCRLKRSCFPSRLSAAHFPLHSFSPLAPFQTSLPLTPDETRRTCVLLAVDAPFFTKNRDMDGRHGGPNSLNTQTMSGGGVRGGGGGGREREVHLRAEMPHMAAEYRGGRGNELFLSHGAKRDVV